MSEHDWKQTPALDEFNAMYDEDDNWWWRIACGHHQNLYEAAVERYERAEAQVQRVQDAAAGFVPIVTGNPQADQMTRVQALKDADTVLRALDGDSDD